MTFSIDGELVGNAGCNSYSTTIAACTVEYPTVQAFFEMTGTPEYPFDVRAGALADSRLYGTHERAR